MPFYSRLKYKFAGDERRRVVMNLQRLIAQLDRDVPTKDSERNLLLATWNIRDFGKTNRRGFGLRLPETHFYIAEILSRFDFVAVQEVNELDEWYEVMSILGSDWDFIATDITDTKLGGNGERLLYLYDKRKVSFQNIAGEIVLPADLLITAATADADDPLARGKQFRRSPFVAAFQSGWFKFDICTVHIYYGADSGPELAERIQEIDRIAGYLGKRAENALEKSRATILLGDFNIVHPQHQTMQALKEHGFTLPKALDRPSNLDLTKYYDQIAFITKPNVLEYIDMPAMAGSPGNAGIFDMYESVMRDSEEDFAQFEAAARATPNGDDEPDDKIRAYYRSWRTYQMSDHKPMWVRIKTNEADDYLKGLLAG
jgi:endonuclease/exonuclease/phosphatase family metal-dependent hydrolase